MACTTREITVTWLANVGFPTAVTIPAGTPLVAVQNGLGTEYAVASVALLISLTGNSHDPKYRYCFVPRDVVGEI